MEQSLIALEERPQDAGLLAEIFRSVHTIKGATGFLGYTRFESLSHAGESLLSGLRDRRLVADADVIDALLELLDRLRSVLASIESQGHESLGDDGVVIAHLESLQNRKSPSQSASVGAVPGSNGRRDFSQVLEWVSTSDSVSTLTANLTVRVDTKLLDRMMGLVGELAQVRDEALEAAGEEPQFAALVCRLSAVTAKLRKAVMDARVQPVDRLFSMFPRMVRDLSRQLGKQVRLEMNGQGIMLDRSLLEVIKGPLMHLIRNAVDHGIEAPDERSAAGKPAVGVIRLRAYSSGKDAVIEVLDDGAGICVEQVRRKAIERGFETEEKAAQMSERELLNLVFLPGFSTAAAVTTISGRGVGMDVVRENLEKIGGRAEIKNHPGRGVVVRMSIPLPLPVALEPPMHGHRQSFVLLRDGTHDLVHLNFGTN